MQFPSGSSSSRVPHNSAYRDMIQRNFLPYSSASAYSCFRCGVNGDINKRVVKLFNLSARRIPRIIVFFPLSVYPLRFSSFIRMVYVTDVAGSKMNLDDVQPA